MAKVVLNSAVSLNPVYGTYAGSDPLDNTSSGWFIQDENSGTVYGAIQGSSITYSSYNSSPLSGTVNSISYLLPSGQTAWTVSGLNISASSGNYSINRGLNTGDVFNDLYIDNYLNGDDVIIGSSANDQIQFSAGKDNIDGGAGVDTMSFSNSGNSVNVNLGSGKYTVSSIISTIKNVENIDGSRYADTLIGDAANNVIHGGDGNDTISGGAGNDSLYGGDGANTLNGGDGNDLLVVTAHYYSTTVNGGTGTDTIQFVSASHGLDINLDAGQAIQLGSTGSDIYATISDVENVVGSALNDKITGDSQNNVINGGAGNDIIDGGLGSDTADFSTSYKAVNVNLAAGTASGYGTDKLISIENVIGSTYSDIVKGSSGANIIKTGNGDDYIFADAGNDVIDGGAGTDTLNFSGVSSGVSVNLSLTTAQNTGGANTDTITNIENIVGTAFADTLLGNAAANVIDSGAGNDKLSGGDGNDILIGGGGADTLTGGAGVDKFVFKSIADSTVAAHDTITDFVKGIDKISLTDIDANTSASGSQHFNLIASTAAFSGAGQIKFSGGVLSGDTNGDGVADFSVTLTGVTSLSASDLIL